MHITKSCALILLAVLVSVVVADLEVLNDVNEEERDDFLESEQFIPADAIAKQNSKAAQRNLASVKQNGQQGKATNADLKVPVQPPAKPDLKSSPNTNNADVKKTSSQDASASQSGASAKSGTVQIGKVEENNDDDDVDLATEGFLLVITEQKSVGHAASSRKLAQIDETYSEETHRTRNIEIMSQESVEEKKATPPKKEVNLFEDLKNSSESPAPSSESSSTKSAASSPSSLPSSSSSSSSSSSASSTNHEVKSQVSSGRQQVHDRLQKFRQDKKSRILELEHVAEGDLLDEDWIDLTIACMDKSSWECLMFKEDYLASRNDANLSNLGENRVVVHRFKRQLDNQDEGSGNDTIFQETKIDDPVFTFTSSSSFPTNETSKTLDQKKKKKIKDDLDKQLRNIFKGMSGFKDVIVDPDSIRIENGTLKVNWKVLVDLGNPAFAGLTPDQINDIIKANLENVRGGVKNNTNIDGFPPLDDFDFDDFVKQLNDQTRDPCNFVVPSPCSYGYGRCRLVDPGHSLQVKCTHKCVIFDETRPCEHGASCDLNMDGEAYCPCTKNWKGKYCEVVNKATDLDGGKIAGVVIGGILSAAGVLGCCFWFFLCFRRKKDIIYTHYSDEEGSGRFSNPSTKLGCVIDRPHISVNPIKVFKPPNETSSSSGHQSLSRRSSANLSGSSDFDRLGPSPFRKSKA